MVYPTQRKIKEKKKKKLGVDIWALTWIFTVQLRSCLSLEVSFFTPFTNLWLCELSSKKFVDIEYFREKESYFCKIELTVKKEKKTKENFPQVCWILGNNLDFRNICFNIWN